MLILTALPLLAIGIFPNQVLLPLTQRSAAFLNRPALSHEVAFFSLTNLLGGGVSLAIGTVVYLFFVRTELYDRKKGYVNRWPGWLDLEELFYRPVFTRFLPWVGLTVASFLDGIPSNRLVTVWIPKGVTAFFSFLDHLPECRLIQVWIPKGVTAVFSFLDHLPESWLFAKFIPGVCITVARVMDSLTDTFMLLIRSLFLTNREELLHAKGHNPIIALSSALAEGWHKAGKAAKKLLPVRDPNDERYGTYLTNAISFGLLLCAGAILTAILYVFIRMGVR